MKAKSILAVLAAAGLMVWSAAAQALPQPVQKNSMGLNGKSGVDQTGHTRNDCGTATSAGVLVSAGSIIAGDNTGAGDDFDGTDPLCGGSFYGTGNGGADVVFSFEVDVCGIWHFGTGCPGDVGGSMAGDTSLQLMDGCPGTMLDCNGDACGGFNSHVEAFLVTGTTYYLVVDSYDPTFEGAFEVAAANVTPCCTVDADCDDGNFCNGGETCNAGTGECLAGTNPCSGIGVTCDEANDACVDPDPCVAWLSGLRGNSFFPAINNCVDAWTADDIQLAPTGGRELVSYEFVMLARGVPSGLPSPIGTPYTVETELWTAAGGGICLPDAPIPGTNCVHNTNKAGGALEVKVGGSTADVIYCAPNGGLPTGIIIADADDDPVVGQCGVDFYIMYRTSEPGAGFVIAGPGNEHIIGGPAMDDEFGQSVFVLEDCPAPTGTFSFGAFTLPTVSDFAETTVCTVPEGPCCDGLGGCDQLSEEACLAANGTYLGDSTVNAPNTCDMPDGDGDGVRDECDLCPMDPDKTAPGQCGCGNPDTDTDGDGTADCNDACPMDPGKIAPGQCGCGVPDDDSDGDGVADCNDGCPVDPNKIDPGICGCGVAETGDSDGDGYLDCVDVCPGVDDDVFAPGCVGAIPTVNEWGVIVLGLLLLAAGKVYFGRRTATA